MRFPESIYLLWTHTQCDYPSKDQHWKGYAQIINRQIGRPAKTVTADDNVRSLRAFPAEQTGAANTAICNAPIIGIVHLRPSPTPLELAAGYPIAGFLIFHYSIFHPIAD